MAPFELLIKILRSITLMCVTENYQILTKYYSQKPANDWYSRMKND